MQKDGRLVGQDGRSYFEANDDLTPDRAQALAAQGALVVWDPCGCGGDCGLTWFTREQVADMVRAGPPKIVRKKHHSIGAIAEWRSSDDHVILLAQDKVKWGTALS